MANGNGGHCVKCDNGDWYCPGENGGIGPGDCPTGGGHSEWRKAGETWYDQEGVMHAGYYVWVRAVCEGGEPIVDVWLQKVYKWVGPQAQQAYVSEEYMTGVLREVTDLYDHDWPPWVRALIRGSDG